MRFAVFSNEKCPLLNITSIGYASDTSVTRFGPGIRNLYIVHYVISGKGTFNGTTVSAGQGFLITPGMQEHYFPDEKEPWEFVWVISDDPIAKTVFIRFDADPKTGVFSYPNISKLKNLADFLISNKNALLNGFEMLEIFLGIFKQQKATDQPKSRTSADIYIEAAEKYIDMNIQNPITVTELTGFLGVTQPYLFRIFKARFEKSPKQYILEQKFIRAKQLLKSTDLSVTHIANSVGFPDVLSFSRCFKKRFLVSPQNYRRDNDKKA